MISELNFKFYFFSINLIIYLKPDTCFSYWKTFKYVLKQLGFVNEHFINSNNGSSISGENLTFELRCSISIIYTPDFKELLPENKDAKDVLNNF